MEARPNSHARLSRRLVGPLILVGLVGLGTAGANPLSDAELEGRRLAREILELQPAENLIREGVMKIYRGRSNPVEIPLRLETVVTETNWTATYSTRGTNDGDVTAFTVIHAPPQPNEYRVLRPAGSGGPTGEVTVLRANAAWIPLAGSDFWLADLGLEFLHWPAQRVLKKEMRRSCFCVVLESVNPQPSPDGYARVVSWIDQDSYGIVHAEAFDGRGKLLKEFSPKDIVKVKGQWQVASLRLRNVQTGSRTQLEFDLQNR